MSDHFDEPTDLPQDRLLTAHDDFLALPLDVQQVYLRLRREHGHDRGIADAALRRMIHCLLPLGVACPGVQVDRCVATLRAHAWLAWDHRLPGVLGRYPSPNLPGAWRLLRPSEHDARLNESHPAELPFAEVPRPRRLHVVRGPSELGRPIPPDDSA